MENNTEDGSPQTWWLDSTHNRLHQSPWLRSKLSELEKKVKNIISLIEDDGDTFAKRAEMFYKNRPLLVESVEDLHGSYRSLAEKYDQLTLRSENLRAISKPGSPISENPNRLSPKLQGSDHDHGQNSDSELEGWVSLESQSEKSKVVRVDDDYEKGWNELGLNVVHDNLEKQAELVKRNDEKREAINKLRAHVCKLVAENNELKRKLANTKADIKQNRSQLSRAKDVILKRIMPESRC